MLFRHDFADYALDLIERQAQIGAPLAENMHISLPADGAGGANLAVRPEAHCGENTNPVRRRLFVREDFNLARARVTTTMYICICISCLFSCRRWLL